MFDTVIERILLSDFNVQGTVSGRYHSKRKEEQMSCRLVKEETVKSILMKDLPPGKLAVILDNYPKGKIVTRGLKPREYIILGEACGPASNGWACDNDIHVRVLEPGETIVV